MNFTQPAYLWTLTAIVVPVAIHLLSRKEGKLVRVGSLRHLEESHTSRFKSVRLNEVWLLLARCLMIIWLAFFLSGLTCSTNSPVSGARWLVVESGIEAAPSAASLIDSLTTVGYELRYLAPGFPPEVASATHRTPNYWKLTEELAEKSDHEIIVISYNRATGFRHKRPTLPSNVRWISVNPNPREFVVQATRLNGDNVAIRTGHSESSGTKFTTINKLSPKGIEWIAIDGLGDSTKVVNRDTVLVSIEEDEPYKTDAQVLRAAIRALEAIPAISVLEVEKTRAHWLFWLRDDAPSGVNSSNLVLLRPRDDANWLSKVGRSTWHLTRRLTADEALRDHFTLELAEKLLAGAQTPKEILANDVSSIPDQMAWSTLAGGTDHRNQVRPVDASIPLIILFLLTWITERAIALRRNL